MREEIIARLIKEIRAERKKKLRQMYVLDEQGCDMCRDWMMMECENCDLEDVEEI